MKSLSGWRKDADYAVLCAPYFQYPQKRSQIYKQSLEENVSLFSWEYLSFMLRLNVKETIELDLSNLWNWPSERLKVTLGNELQNSYLRSQDSYLIDFFGSTDADFSCHMLNRITALKRRGNEEIGYWNEKINEIRTLTREEAIAQLIQATNVNGKIQTIKSYVNGLWYGVE